MKPKNRGIFPLPVFPLDIREINGQVEFRINENTAYWDYKWYASGTKRISSLNDYVKFKKDTDIFIRYAETLKEAKKFILKDYRENYGK